MKIHLKEFKVIHWSDIKKNYTFENSIFDIKDSPERKGLFHVTQFSIHSFFDGNMAKDLQKMLTILQECGADFVDFDN